MSVLKKIAAWFSVLLLFVGLIGLAWSVVGHLTVRNESTVKGWLLEAGVYENITDTVLETAAKDTAEESGDDFDINNPIISNAVDDAFSPEYLQEKTEVVLDSVYAWLNGEAVELAFKIELAEAKIRFIDAAAKYAAEQAAELPVCTNASQIQDYDPINAKCVPPGYTPSDVESEVKSQLTANEDFLEKTSFGASDIKVGDDEQAFSDSSEAASIKKAYKYAAYAPIVFGVIALLGLVGAVLFSPRKLFGVRRTGAVLVSSGVILGISWIFLRLGQSISTANISTPTDSEASKSLIAGIIRVITQDIAGVLIWFVLGYILAGIGLLVWVGIKKRGQTPPDKDDESQPKKAEVKTDKSTRETAETPRTHQPPVKPRNTAPTPRRKIQL